MFDPYLVGCLIQFSNYQNVEGVFTVTDEYCSIQQLYRINELYRESLTHKDLLDSLQNISSKVIYSTKNKFNCIYGKYFENLPTIPFENESENWKYITGVVDTYSVLDYSKDISLKIYSFSNEFLKGIQEFIKIPSMLYESFLPASQAGVLWTLEFRSTNVIDLFGKLVGSFKRYELNQLLQERVLPECRVIRKDPDAVFPFKARLSDVGYDLTVIRKHKDLTSNTALYDTGIAIDIPFKYYAEIAPRSSLSKSGYMLSNSIGIIDPGYKGNLYIALTKVSPEVPEISFPFRCGQLIFKRQVYVDLVEAESTESMESSTRGEGGYGSTG
jgi:deoxyuridine 5'-triphosphate nucleotidohydrolase